MKSFWLDVETMDASDKVTTLKVRFSYFSRVQQLSWHCNIMDANVYVSKQGKQLAKAEAGVGTVLQWN